MKHINGLMRIISLLGFMLFFGGMIIYFINDSQDVKVKALFYMIEGVFLLTNLSSSISRILGIDNDD